MCQTIANGGIVELLFFISFIFISYTYVGYPVLLKLRKMFTSHSSLVKEDILGLPDISVVIAVHNEELNIARRIEDVKNQNYPANKMQIVVVSDGSTDRTVDVLHDLSDSNLKVIILPDNNGKAAALNIGLAEASGEIIVFTDARQFFAPNAIFNLMQAFSDPVVGCVSGELIFLQDVESSIQAEMGAYWVYEKWIRKAESSTGSTVGATGAIYAIRKNLFRPLPHRTILDDVLTPLNIVMQGYRCLFHSESIAYDVISKDVKQEWKRKVRTLAGNWQILSASPIVLLPWRNPLWWRFLSHKIFRLLVPFALVVFLFAGVMAEGRIYCLASIFQLLFYSVVLIALSFPSTRKYRIVNVSYFFLMMNLAAVVGFWVWVTDRCDTAWQSACKTTGIVRGSRHQ